MRILGICHDVHICSACVVDDGQVVAAIPEERIDRVKQSRVFPTGAIAESLRLAGLTLSDIDEIAVAWNPVIDAETVPGGYLAARRWRTEHLMQVPGRFLRMGGGVAGDLVRLEHLWQGAPPITYVGHYEAHIANALFFSPFDCAAVLILDGRGERHTGLLAKASGVNVETLAVIDYPHSLGLFYGTVTQFLGFRMDSDEWKVMALGAYAEEPNEFVEPMRRLIRVHDDGRFTMALEYFAYYNSTSPTAFSERFTELFGPPRQRDEPITTRHHRIAAAMQVVFEESVTAVCQHLHERTGVNQLVVNGGCFMNSLFNGKLTRVTPFRECFIGSCPDDSGTSIGAALWLHARRTGFRPTPAAGHNYWGAAFTDAECLATARRYKLPNVTVLEDPSAAAARDLVAGKLLGWFQGRAEFGQRALGARSILADPRRAETKDVVNAAVKYRESFRPFAPAVLAERVTDFFDCPQGTTVPYMERVLPFHPEKRSEVPAVVHQDGTGRLQTVGKDAEPRYRSLIEHFDRLTGVPVVLNTSFNLNGEPMVYTPDDAIRTFYACGLDVLYLGNVRIEKDPDS